MTEPITPSFHKIASFCALLVLSVPLAWPQNGPLSTGQNPDPTASQTDLPTALGELSKYQGVTVHAIEFRGIKGTNPEMLRQLLVQKTGEPLDRDKIRASLRVLYATGRFSTLQVEAEPNQQKGLSLVFVATENYFNGDVKVDGAPAKTNPKPHQLVESSKLDLGATFSQESVDRSVERMLKVMADNGYYKATITYDLIPHDDTRQMDINFHVVPGERARVGEVTIEGDTGIPPDKVRSLTKLKSGDKVKQEHVARALERLRQKYQKNDHLEAQVSLIDRHYHPDTNRLDYVFKAEEGPTVAISADGAKISNRELKKLVPVYQENSVDDDLLNEGRRNMRDYLQTKGYFDVTVEVERRPVPEKNHLNIVYNIDPGVRHKLAAVRLEGNKYFDTDTIRERIAIQPSSIILSNGRFSQRLLADDLAVIKNLYQANGFLGVKVTSDLQDDYQGRENQMAVVIKIEEGPQTLVNSLKVAGNNTFPLDRLTRLLSCTEGQPYSEANVAGDRDAVTYFYYNRGFPNVQFEAAASPAPGEPQRMQVTYTITEGEQVFVDRVLVSGREYTRAYVVNREMRIGDGDPLSQARMVDSQRRLYDLGLFNQVDMAVQNPDGQEPSKDVLFNLQEAKRWTFRYGGGLEFATGNVPTTNNPQGKTGVSPNGVLEITRLNMFGRDQTLTFRARVGLLTRRALIGYDAPRLFHSEKWRFNATAFYDNTADVNTFTSERLDGTVQAEQKYSRPTTLLYRLSFQRVAVDPNSLVIDPTLIPLYSKPVRLAIPSFTYVRDTRDNPIDSHKGSYNIADLGLATSALGSQANFGKVLLQNSTYYTFKKRWVFARNTQIGILHPYGTNNFLSPPPIGSKLPTEATSVPLPELFFAGGSNSLRSFSINQAGPRDLQTGYPIGGQGLFVNNLEIRTPPVALPFVGDNLGFVFFHDMGNVFDTANHIISGMLRIHQPSIANCSAPTSTATCNFSYNPQAVGMGVRYKTPVGPVRLDVGYNFNPTRYPIQLQDTSTHTPVVQTLRHINFYFSIGQTF
ncbi:MAG TPA: outer membrane protein assembly factor BamA [Candidatus Limnocylindrales bacterium]|nr:outer membrane protein assembly factor BamA [Candidatus Limnocylindrales bacterium]